MQYIAYLNAPIAEYLPSGWLTQALNSLLIKKTYLFLLNASYLMITAAILVYIIIFLSSKFYFSSWAAGQIGGIRSSTRRKEPKKMKFNRHVFINRILNALISKDLKLFFRDTKQWSQILLVIALTIVYIFSICKLPMRISGDKESAHRYLSDFIGFFNIGGTGFILAALSLRFVFPQVSLERGSIWLVLSAPINIKTFIFEKMLISTLLITSLGVTLVVITNMLLGVTQSVFWFSIFTIIIISIGLCSLSIGIGSIYPKFNIENIAQLEISYGGIVCILCSLLYIGLTLTIEARAIQMFIRQAYTHQAHINTLHIVRYCGIDLLLLNIVVIFFPLWAGIRSIKKYELGVSY
jgi:ABC-2 type transport system permease protein